MKVSLCFPVFEFSKKLTRELSLKERMDEARGRTPKSRIRSNRHGWQGVLPLEDVASLKIKIRMAVEEEMMVYLGVSKSTCHISQMWGNINSHSSWNVPHTHPGSFYAGVYYVSAQEDMGDCVLVNTHSVILDNIPYAPKLRLEHKITPKTGYLHLFPSGQFHYVEPNRSNTPRYSISFNIKVTCEAKDRIPGSHIIEEEV